MNINNESILFESEGKLLHFGMREKTKTDIRNALCRPHLFKKLTLQCIFLENRIVMHNKSRREKEKPRSEFHLRRCVNPEVIYHQF